MKNLLIVLIGLVTLVVLLFLVVSSTNKKMDESGADITQNQFEGTATDMSNPPADTYISYVLKDESGAVQATITYNENDLEQAILAIDGTEYSLMQTIAASGIRYENADGTVVYSESQGEVEIEIDGEIVHQGLLPELSPESESASAEVFDAEADISVSSESDISLEEEEMMSR